MHEIELKLDLQPGDAEALESFNLFGSQGCAVEQISTYFDTAEHALFDAGLSLRIRQTGRKRVQTVKAENASGAGLFTRPEWERPVRGKTPVMDAHTPIPRLLAKHPGELAPQFEIHVLRTTWQLDVGDSMIEVALDRGEIHADERRELFCEAELELKNGDPESLFALADRIDAKIPARLSVLSKAERGYRLEERHRASKAERVCLDQTMPVEDAFRRIIASCLRQYRLNEAVLLGRRARSELHQARVALRRLRSALTIFRPILGDQRDRLTREVRHLAAILGKARDYDVFIAHLGPGPARDAAGAAHDSAYAEVEAALAARRTRRLLLDIAHWASPNALCVEKSDRDLSEMPVERFAAEALDRRWKRIAKYEKHLEGLDEAKLHQLRKDLKKLRYCAEFFASLRHGRDKARHELIASMKSLAAALGELVDGAIARKLIAELGLADEPEIWAIPSIRDRDKLLKRAARCYSRLKKAKPYWR
jgi:triphosphatase